MHALTADPRPLLTLSRGTICRNLRNLHRVVVNCMQQASCLLERDWLLDSPATKIKRVKEAGNESFLLLQDELLHPLLGGNKLRKLDALVPYLIETGTTDVVTCGGLQSAHTAAVAVACAEAGICAHLLVRGERPAVPTGFHLVSRLFGEVAYISRAEYSNRAVMLEKRSTVLKYSKPEAKVYTIAEGGAHPLALLGLVRLVHYLATSESLSPTEPHSIVVDSGTGTTATGLAIGVTLLQLPWKVVGVMLAGSKAYYQKQQEELTASFYTAFPGCRSSKLTDVQWVARCSPRKFGVVLKGEIAQCAKIARSQGVLLDPIYTLAAWETAERLSRGEDMEGIDTAEKRLVVLLHTGGGLGLHGLAQRFPKEF